MKIHLSEHLSLPLDAVTQKLAFIGRTGSGKTYAATSLAECLYGVQAQFVALDPVGVWWGLRLAADGKTPGLPVPVFGGLHGDVPLEPGAGHLMADLIVDRAISAVLDVSQFESNADKARFAEAFASRFFYRKKASPSAIHLFVEEAQEFIPQNPGKGEERMLGAFERLIKLGRNFGIGASLISQRPQEVNKKALNQTECLFAFQMTGTHERKAVEAWIADKGLDEDIAGMLPKLAVGEPHVWSPQWLQISKTIHIATKQTFNASATPKVGERVTETKPLAPVDLERIRADMAATIERAKAEDPKELRKRIAHLESELKKKTSAASARPDPDAVSRATEKAVSDLKRQIARLIEHQSRNLERVKASIQRHMIGISGSIESIEAFTFDTTVTVPSPAPVQQRKAQPQERRPVAVSNGGLPVGERAILIAAAQYDDGARRDQLSVLTGYKRSSRDAYISRLLAKQLVEINGAMVIATDAGRDALGNDYEPLPTGLDLREHWMRKLPEGEAKVLAILIEANGEDVEREAIDEATGYKRSSRDAYLSRLAMRRLVETTSPGMVRASKDLF